MHDFKYSREYKWLSFWRRHQIVIVLILLVSCILVATINYVTRNKYRELSEDFQNYLDSHQYSEALQLYRKIQDKATGGEANNKYLQLQDQYEKTLSTHMVNVVDTVLKTGEISQEDARMIRELEELGAASISHYFEQVTKDWLSQKRSYDEWLNLMNVFNHIPNLKLATDNFLQQESNLLKAAVAFSRPIKLTNEKISDWQEIIPAWQAVIDNEEMGEYARSYARDLLAQYKEQLLPEIMRQVDNYVAHRKSYSAKYLLDQMLTIFPDNKEILKKMDDVGIDINTKIVNWHAGVEAINIRVLKHDTSKTDNGQGLLTPDQFRNLLQALYDGGYVLISADILSSYPEVPLNIVVPEGKIPLILIIDNIELNRQQVNSGSFTQVYYDEEKNEFVGEIGRSKSNPNLVAGEDVFSILNEFIHNNPDFSFDGARAVVSVSGANGILGHSLKIQQEKAITMLKKLEEQGYQIASNTYNRIDLGLEDVKEIKKDFEQWNSKIRSQLSEDVRILVYPFGSHPYASPEILEAVLADGYHLLIGIGPRVYNFSEDQYVHIDAVEINADSIAGNYFELNNISDLSGVLD